MPLASWRARSRRPTCSASRFRPSTPGIRRRRAVSSVAIVLECLVGDRGRGCARPAADFFDVIADVGGVEHAASILVSCVTILVRCRGPSAKPCFPPPASAPGSFPPPRRSRRKCCRWSTSRSSSTASRRRSPPASTTSSSSPAAARTRSRITSTSRSSSRRFSKRAARREQLEEIRKISNMINFAYVRQGEPLGLGHAVLVTRELVGDEPFAVILADDVIDADPPALQADDRRVRRVGGPVLAVERVPREDISSYGVIRSTPNASSATGIYQVRDLVEKPPKDEAPSDLAIIGRYILTPDIFPALAATQERSHRRDPADQRPARAAEEAADLRLRGQRRPPRHRQQARVPEGGGLLRAAAAGSRGAVLGATCETLDRRSVRASTRRRGARLVVQVAVGLRSASSCGVDVGRCRRVASAVAVSPTQPRLSAARLPSPLDPICRRRLRAVPSSRSR